VGTSMFDELSTGFSVLGESSMDILLDCSIGCFIQ
jgi:hypothetical protein